jgi:anti-anti-sigma factor
MNTMCRQASALRAAAVVWESRLADASMLHVEGALHAAQGTELRHEVQSLLKRGERTIFLSLARVPKIDAGGIGELVRAYNLTTTWSGVFRVVHASERVRRLLIRVGLNDILSSDA